MRERKERKENINNEIITKNVRIIGTGTSDGIMSLDEALRMAVTMDVDLVQISQSDNIAVCKLIDFNKYLYMKKIKQKEIQQKSKKTKQKEIKFSYNIGEHDFNFKLKHAEKFLKNGDKVKAFILFKGRDIMNIDNGKIVLLKFADSLNKYGKPDGLPRLDGKKLIIEITPI
jgi:translation initiation factor IF-3